MQRIRSGESISKKPHIILNQEKDLKCTIAYIKDFNGGDPFDTMFRYKQQYFRSNIRREEQIHIQQTKLQPTTKPNNKLIHIHRGIATLIIDLNYHHKHDIYIILSTTIHFGLLKPTHNKSPIDLCNNVK